MIATKFKPPVVSTNIVERLHTVEDVVKNWPFLLECMQGLNKKARADYTSESFFFTLIKAIQLGVHGLVVVLKNAEDIPLGFGCAFAATDFHGEQCFYVWATYSTGVCRTTLSELMEKCEEYARAIHFSVIKLSTPRINGAADRLFEGLGFEQEFLTYKKIL